MSERRQPNGEQDSSREQGSPPVQESSESASRIKGQTAWVVLASQMLGLAIGVSQGLLVEHPDRELVALSIVLVLGPRAVENLLLRMIDRFFDRITDSD